MIDVILRYSNSGGFSGSWDVTIGEGGEIGGVEKTGSHSKDKRLPFHPLPFTECLNRFVPKSQLFFEKYYQRDPYYLLEEEREEEEGGEEGRGGGEGGEGGGGREERGKGEGKEEGEKLEPPILRAPPLKRIWVVNGINRFTEVGYYFKMDLKSKLAMDPSADRYSGKKLAGFVEICRNIYYIFIYITN